MAGEHGINVSEFNKTSARRAIFWWTNRSATDLAAKLPSSARRALAFRCETPYGESRWAGLSLTGVGKAVLGEVFSLYDTASQ